MPVHIFIHTPEYENRRPGRSTRTGTSASDVIQALSGNADERSRVLKGVYIPTNTGCEILGGYCSTVIGTTSTTRSCSRYHALRLWSPDLGCFLYGRTPGDAN